MNRPTVEVADILRAHGDSYIDRHRDRIRFQQLKVMSAIVRCRTAALGGHIDTCAQCGSDRTISYNSCRNRHCQNARLRRGSVGSLLESGNFWRSLTSMSCSRCRMNCTRSSYKTRPNSIACCSMLWPRRLWRSRKTRNILALTSASSASCTRGARTCCSILMSTVSFQGEESHGTTRSGSIPVAHSSCL